MDRKLIDFTSLFDRFAIVPDYIYVTLFPWKTQSIQIPAPVTELWFGSCIFKSSTQVN